MPIYEYHCPKCNKNFEELRKSSGERDKTNCPDCGIKASIKLSTFRWKWKRGVM